MDKKLLLLCIVAALIIAIAGVALIYQAMQPQDAYDILNSSKNAVENLESMTADAYFSQYIDTESIKVDSQYSTQLELLRDKGMRINFENYECECSGEEKIVARVKTTHEKIKESLKNAWIIDKNDNLYFYAPLLSEENITEFAPRSSLLRYNAIIPITDSLQLAELFDHAENATYEGIETINIGDSSVEAYVVSYMFRDPTIKFVDKAELRSWISTSDYIPLKTELNATSGGAKISFDFGFHSYEKNVPIPPENLSLPRNLKVIQR